MKVLLVNTYDTGGAAQACIRLHKALLQQGVQSKLMLLHKTDYSIPESYQYFSPGPKITLLQRFVNLLLKPVAGKYKILPIEKSNRSQEQFLAHRQDSLEYFSFPNTSFDITDSIHYKEADVVNLHWVANFLDWESFFKKNTKPLVWTFHDENAFLGGEHYAEQYFGISEDGLPLKREQGSLEQHWEQKLLAIKTKALSANTQPLQVVCPSRWLLNQSQKSVGFKSVKHHLVPYGLEENIFKPHEKAFSREVLGLPAGKLIVLFVSDNLHKNRKGYIYLKKALLKIENETDVVLCAVGHASGSSAQTGSIYQLGAVKDQRMMSIIYSAADLFVIPSLQDNLPNTVLESLMCGTPVVGFPVGGIPDMLINGVNGLLCSEISVSALSATIISCLQQINRFNRNEISNKAREQYKMCVQANRYREVYTKISDEV